MMLPEGLRCNGISLLLCGRCLQDNGFWLMKNNMQRGEGIRLVPTDLAWLASWESHGARGLLGLMQQQLLGAEPLWIMAQQYIANPLLINDRKWHIRLFVYILPGFNPFRAYISTTGIVNFADEPFSTKSKWECTSHGNK
jgi:hypothetical protein